MPCVVVRAPNGCCARASPLGGARANSTSSAGRASRRENGVRTSTPGVYERKVESSSLGCLENGPAGLEDDQRQLTKTLADVDDAWRVGGQLAHGEAAARQHDGAQQPDCDNAHWQH